jgi:hypothetical protein
MSFAHLAATSEINRPSGKTEKKNEEKKRDSQMTGCPDRFQYDFEISFQAITRPA